MKPKGDYPTTREILYLLGIGTLVAASVVAPGAGYIAKSIIDWKDETERKNIHKEWLRFNQAALKRNIKRLQQQKVVEIVNVNGTDVVKLTSKGRTKCFKFKLEEISLKKQKWDGKWRIIMYDISKHKKNQQSAFRAVIKRINILLLQKSVYVTPYPCAKEIAYLREYFEISDDVILIQADAIENETAYRAYFGV